MCHEKEEDMSSYSEGQIHQLAEKLEAAGYSAADITRLGQFDKLLEIREVLYERSEIVTVEHIIDCDKDPFVPQSWKVEEHIKGGHFEWDPAKIDLYLSKKQKKGVIRGNDLRKELKGKPVFNANALDYLLSNQHLIPEEWKGKFMFFWGTIYRSSTGGLAVRYLSWGVSRWRWNYRWLDYDWDVSGPAALLASSN